MYEAWKLRDNFAIMSNSDLEKYRLAILLGHLHINYSLIDQFLSLIMKLGTNSLVWYIDKIL